MKKKTIQGVQVVFLTGCLVLGGFSASSWAAEANLIDAASAGDLARVRSLLAAGSDVNAKDKDGVTALMKASQSGRIEVVRALLEAKANVNAKLKNGSTALMYAMKNDHVDVVRALLAAGADVNAKDKDGVTSLMMSGIEAGKELDKFWEEFDELEGKKTTKHIEKVDMVRALLAAGADVNAKDKDGFTALMYASGWGNVKVVRALLEAKADVNVKSTDGTTPLKTASKGGYADVVKLLKQAGAKE